MGDAARRVLPVANLREFFRDTLRGALVRQHLAVEDQTEHYVVNLLTLFARSEALYENTPEGLRLKPLAAMLCDALEAAPGTAERLDNPVYRDASPGLKRLYRCLCKRSEIAVDPLRRCSPSTGSAVREDRLQATDDITGIPLLKGRHRPAIW